MSKRRLLFLTQRFAPDLGGVARSASRTAHAIAHLGYEVHVLAWTKLQQAGELQSWPVESQQTSGVSTVHLHRLGLFSNLDLSLQHSMNVLEWLHSEHAFDALWGHYVYPAGFLAVMFAEANGLPSIISARGNDIDQLMFPPGDFARLEWTLRRATGVSAVSHDLARKIDVLLNAEQRASVVHNSVDVEVFQRGPADVALRSGLRIDEEDAVLGFCGELRHKKGLPFLLASLSRVNAERPARLLVIGAVRPREQVQLSTFFTDHPELEDRVVVTGVLDEPAQVAAHLRLCDVVLSPSIWDGLPNAVLEAMACGVPCIASDAGGIPEVIEHQKNGFLIPKSQLNRLGDAVLELLEQPDEHVRPIREAARARVLEHFDAETERRRLAEVLDKAILS